MSIVRDLWTRVTIGAPAVQVATAEPVRVQQQLEGTVTMVAEVTLAGTTPALVTNDPVAVWHVNRAPTPTAPNYDARQLFNGVVNRITGVGTPHGVTVSCTGELAKLRRTRTTDYSLRGKTDIEVARAVLTYCGITYSSGDIHGWGYELGRAQPEADDDEIEPFWRAGQSGADMIAELDRVFACATIEIGDGRIIRFPYSKVPNDYDDPRFAREFVRGQRGVTFYGSERDRGDIDRIANHWIVRGLSYTGAEGEVHEGCQFEILATGDADHAKLGAGVVVGPQEFQSDLIDSEELAKAIARRLMRWHNREPDTCRIDCGNDARVGPGHLITVRDPSYGIDNPSTRRYLVTAVTRDGDTMTIDAVGGAPGVIETVRGTRVRRCNETETDIGTDPPAFDVPDPILPDVPDLSEVPPDPPPVEEPPPAEEVPDTVSPFIDCTAIEDGMAVVPVIEGGRYVDHDDLLSSNYRAGGNVAAHVTAALDIDHIALAAGGVLAANDTEPIEDKTADNDTNVSAGPGVVTVSGEVWFQYEGASLEVTVQGFDAIGMTNALRARFSAVPGDLHTWTGAIGVDDDIDYYDGISLYTENSVPRYSPYGPANSCEELFRACDNGGFAYGGGVRIDQWMPFTLAFDFSGEYQRIDYAMAINAITDGTVGMPDIAGTPGAALSEGHMEDLRAIYIVPGSPVGGGGEVHYDVCDDTRHTVDFAATGLGMTEEDGDEPETWQVRLRAVVVGHTTCAPNPDFIPPITDGTNF